MKTCRVCRVGKALSEFSFQDQNKASGVLKRICKACDTRRAKEYHAKNRERVLRRQRRVYHSIDGHPKQLWGAMNNRVKRKASYRDRRIVFSRAEFLSWMESSREYKRAFLLWQAAYFDKAYTPTVDRIDNAKDYSLDNIQILPMGEHSRKSYFDIPSSERVYSRRLCAH